MRAHGQTSAACSTSAGLRSLHAEPRCATPTCTGEHVEHAPFQASTIGRCSTACNDGDLTFAEPGERGDLGLGMLNALAGEMIVLDGDFFLADVDGSVPRDRPGGAVSVRGRDAIRSAGRGDVRWGLEHEELLARSTRRRRTAVVVRGPPRRRFASVRARSVPVQGRPPRSAEVVADQHVFELADVEGSMVASASPPTSRGSRSPATTCTSSTPPGAAAATSSARAPAGAAGGIDPPTTSTLAAPAVDLADPDLAAATHAAIERPQSTPASRRSAELRGSWRRRHCRRRASCRCR